MSALSTFADDVAFLSKYGPIIVLEAPGGGRVAISAKYQGRVMTSAVDSGGQSLGFINRGFIEAGNTGTQFDNYGGEDRFWLGPEAGQYGLFFPAGKPFEFTHWQTPRDMQEGEWAPRAASATGVTFSRRMLIPNYSTTIFDIDVERKVSVLSANEAAAHLRTALPSSLAWVGFATCNTIKNAGTNAWTPEIGLPGIWILGMYAPLPGTHVIMPFDKAGDGEIVNDRYFGKVPSDRLTVHEAGGFLVFKCDGRYRSKIGLGPSRAKPALGSYSDESKLLTIVLYSKPEVASRYVNSMWEIQDQPYSGDVVNSYNDGASVGGFYEIETSSPAAALAPGATLTHVHQTYHFVGPREALDVIAKKVLGASLDQVK